MSARQTVLTIEEVSQAITSTPLDFGAHVVIAVTGGTNSGKTTFVKRIVDAKREDIVHFPQDTFQLGLGFEGLETSKYRADDPANFALGECVIGLASLKEGNNIVVPLITPQRYERHGTQVIHPKPLILWEGIYAVLTPELEALADKIVYVDTPYAVRIMRRITRFIEERGGTITDEQASSSPTHMLSSILLAEKNFVITQKTKADYVVRYDENLTEEAFEIFKQATKNLTIATALGKAYGHRSIGNGSLDLYDEGLAIHYQDEMVYAIHLDSDTIRIAKDNFDYILEN